MLGHGPRALAACSSKCLHFRGGNSGVGVTTGKELVYLVFWGSQWGTQGTNGQGYATFSGDPQGVAPDLQAFFSGLGSSADRWSGVMTQYCEGVAAGATTCPSSAPHVAFPAGGALAGIWEDTSGSSPAQSTGHQLALEAEKAATHFGNTTTASNRDAQYVILSPNPGNNLDGVTIVEGHEYAETITGQFPAGGWTANNGEENGDLCAWKASGAGHVQNITLPTGTFAVQGTWSNLANTGAGGCAIKHAIVT